MESSAEQLNIDELELIDRVSDEFVEALRADPGTPIVSFAERVPDRLRPLLLRELVRRHVEVRRARGETPRRADYADLQGESVLHLSEAGYFAAGDSVGPFDSTVDQSTPVSPPWPPARERSEGDEMDRYRLTSLLGRGSFGEVWQAWDTKFEQDVAVKLLRADRGSPEMQEQFEREARRQAKLRDVPGIVTIYDVGEHEGQIFLVSEYVPGGTLKDRLPELSREERLRIVAETARILQRAHAKGLVHRDVKPANILLDTDGHAVLTDFGIAATQTELVSEPDHMIVGTYAYMSPEQLEGRASRSDPRTDVYSLGVVLYECLVGERPFAASEGDRDLLHKTMYTREPWPPRSKDDSIPSEIEGVCLKCLARDPDERFSSAGDVARELGRRPLLGRRSWFALAGAGGATALLATIFGPGDPEPPAPRVPGRVFQFPMDNEATWSPTDGGAGLQVVSESMALLSLGEMDGEPLNLRFELRKLSANGVVGLFFAFDPGDATPRFQVVELLGDDLLRLRAMHYTLRAGDVDRTVESEFATANTVLRSWEPQPFEVRFDELGLRDLVVGGRSFERLLSERRETLELLRVEPVRTGTYGIWCDGASARISSLEVNGVPLRFDHASHESPPNDDAEPSR